MLPIRLTPHWATRQTNLTQSRRDFKLKILPITNTPDDPNKGKIDGVEMIKDLISKDADNALTLGSDDKLYIPQPTILTKQDW